MLGWICDLYYTYTNKHELNNRKYNTKHLYITKKLKCIYRKYNQM